MGLSGIGLICSFKYLLYDAQIKYKPPFKYVLKPIMNDWGFTITRAWWLIQCKVTTGLTD